MGRWTLPIVAVAFLGLMLARPASAVASWGGVVDLEFGLKGMGGYNHWTKPADGPYDLANQDVAFSNTRGGYGAGGGLYVQLRFFRYLGLEIDLLFEDDLLWEHPLADHDWQITARRVNLRIPMMIQGVLPLPGVRLALGIGPEFVVPLSHWTQQSDAPSSMREFQFKSDSTTTTRLTFGLNITVKLWRGIMLPIDLRASYDPAQPSDWQDRVGVPPSCAAGQAVACARDLYDPAVGFRLHQRNTWDFRMLIGLGFDFPAMLGR